MLKRIQMVVDKLNSKTKFQLVFSTPHKEVLYLVKKHFREFTIAYDREIPPRGVVNYNRFTTIPNTRNLENQFFNIGLPIYDNLSKTIKPDPWIVYRFILTRDFKLRDNYKKTVPII